MTTPEPKDPWADPGYHLQDPASPMSGAFYRATGEYAAAENAAAEAEPGDQPVPYTLTPQAEAVLDAGPEPEPEPEAELSEPWWAAHVAAREAGLEPEAGP